MWNNSNLSPTRFLKSAIFHKFLFERSRPLSDSWFSREEWVMSKMLSVLLLWDLAKDFLFPSYFMRSQNRSWNFPSSGEWYNANLCLKGTSSFKELSPVLYSFSSPDKLLQEGAEVLTPLFQVDSSDTADYGISQVRPQEHQPWMHIRRTDAEAEAPILWPPDAKSRLIGKYPDVGKDWGQEDKGATEDEIVGWHH